MEVKLVYPDIPNAEQRISEKITETLFNVIVDEIERGGPIMEKLNALIQKEIDILEEFKKYNNQKIKEYRGKNTEYAKGYINALKEQTKILDEQLNILNCDIG